MPFSPVISVIRGPLLGVLLGLLLTTCGPGMYLSVTPTGRGANPVSNLVSHPDSVYVRFQFVRAEAQELVFEAEFSNAANDSVSVNPAEFYYLPLTDSLTSSPAALALFPGRY